MRKMQRESTGGSERNVNENDLQFILLQLFKSQYYCVNAYVA